LGDVYRGICGRPTRAIMSAATPADWSGWNIRTEENTDQTQIGFRTEGEKSAAKKICAVEPPLMASIIPPSNRVY